MNPYRSIWAQNGPNMGSYGPKWIQKSQKMAPSGAETNSIKESQQSKMRSSHIIKAMKIMRNNVVMTRDKQTGQVIRFPGWVERNTYY